MELRTWGRLHHNQRAVHASELRSSGRRLDRERQSVRPGRSRGAVHADDAGSAAQDLARRRQRSVWRSTVHRLRCARADPGYPRRQESGDAGQQRSSRSPDWRMESPHRQPSAVDRHGCRQGRPLRRRPHRSRSRRLLALGLLHRPGAVRGVEAPGPHDLGPVGQEWRASRRCEPAQGGEAARGGGGGGGSAEEEPEGAELALPEVGVHRRAEPRVGSSPPIQGGEGRGTRRVPPHPAVQPARSTVLRTIPFGDSGIKAVVAR